MDLSSQKSTNNFHLQMKEKVENIQILFKRGKSPKVTRQICLLGTRKTQQFLNYVNFKWSSAWRVSFPTDVVAGHRHQVRVRSL